MLAKNRQCKSVWQRKNSESSNIIDFTTDDPSFEQLKTVSKRLAIMSRLQKKAFKRQTTTSIKTKTTSHIDLIEPNTSKSHKNITQQKRPATSGEKRGKNFNINSLKQVCKEQRKVNEYLLGQKYQSTIKTSFSNAQNIKQGLLGQYDRYNEMTKQELIEKLISLQYLANNIFKKNKALEEKIKSMDPTFQKYETN